MSVSVKVYSATTDDYGNVGSVFEYNGSFTWLDAKDYDNDLSKTSVTWRDEYTNLFDCFHFVMFVIEGQHAVMHTKHYL